VKENVLSDSAAVIPPAGAGHLSVNERLSLIALIDEGLRSALPEEPLGGDLFDNLWELVNKTVSGSRINRFTADASKNGFRIFEINAETGESLGRLNMLYLKKPIPCYYLVYVEVAPPFRRKGLGSKIIKYFGEFLAEKSAVGILDNIIPKDDPTYDIYRKNGWKSVAAILKKGMLDKEANYMVFIPPDLTVQDLEEPLGRLLYHLKRKRTVIDMRDNEVMVTRTIAEFKELYQTLLTYFSREIERGESSDFMRFLFTRFVTKFIAFRRRIETLLGYTGGESTEQIVLLPEIARLPVKSYAPRALAQKTSLVIGDEALFASLPPALQEEPARVIEQLPNYRRPSLMTWLADRGRSYSTTLTIGDLMDLGFDPTRLKEITVNGEAYIFERVQVRQLPELQKKNDLLRRVTAEMRGVIVRSATLKANPLLLVIRDRGNAYVLRRQVGGIHWEEAVEQLQGNLALHGLNTAMRCEAEIVATVQDANERIARHMGMEMGEIQDQLTTFVSWDLEQNRPRMIVDHGGRYSMEAVWMA
jgi:GNAT superfamily N-acetyltransferase